MATISSSSLPAAYTISRSNTIPRVKPSKSGKQSKHIDIPINFAQTNHDEMFIVGDKGILFEISPEGNLSRITDLSQYIAQRGHISHIIRNNQGNYYISFSTEGCGRGSRKTTNMNFRQPISRYPSVSSVWRNQKTRTWYGSDPTAAEYTQSGTIFYNVRSFDFNTFGNKISNPVRSHIRRRQIQHLARH